MPINLGWAMSQITHFYGVKFVAWKSGSVKKMTNIMSGPEEAVLQKQNLAFCSAFHFIPPFLEQVSNLSQLSQWSSLEMADSYSFMGDVCPVFTSPPLIPPNWSCLQRDSVSTHRRRHRIRYLPLSPLNLNLVHTLGKISSCLSPAVQCSVFANKSGHCAPWSEKTSFVHLTTFSSR